MITFSALVNIVLFSSVSVILLSIVFKDNKVVLKLDIRFLLACMFIILIRLLVPIESPITNNIPVSNVYPDIYMFLKEPFYTLADVEINVLFVMKLIWLIGAVYSLIKVRKSYHTIGKIVNGYPNMDEAYITMALQKVQSECKRKKKAKFRLVMGEMGSTPFVFGVLRPCIVIPPMSFDEEEIYFILKHEVIHYYRGDLIIKICCEILRAVYWWNPFASILTDLISDMQEINVDFKIMKELQDEKKLDYSECLVKIARKRAVCMTENRWILAFQKESPSAVHKRISLMMDNLEIDKKKTAKSIMLSVIILSLVVLCPNVLIFEPYAISEEDEEGTFDINKDNVYYLRNTDGTFDLYWDEEYVATVTEVLGGDIPIYNSE